MHLDFWGRPIHVLVCLLLLALVTLKISVPPVAHVQIFNIGPRVPIADAVLLWSLSILLAALGVWVFEAVCRWFCRCLKFSNGAAADFSGHGGQILGWWIVLVLAGRDYGRLGRPAIALEIALYFLGIWSTLKLIRWFVGHVELKATRFHFVGTYGQLLGWEILLAVSAITIIGWAWVLAALYRWLAHNTRAAEAALHFHGEGGQILWRTVAAIVFSLPIVTIPWAWLWYARWVVRNTTIEGHIEPAAA